MNKHLAAVSLAGVFVLCATLALGGCRRSAAPPALGPADQNAQVLQQIRQFQEESGKSLAWLSQEVERAKQTSLEQAGDPPAVRELAVARFYLRDADDAATAMDAKAMAATLAALQRTLQLGQDELPARQIALHAQRALYLIRREQAAAQNSFTAASVELQAAQAAAQNGRPASAVPQVLKDLSGAKAAADRGDGEAARETLMAVLTTLDSDALVAGFTQAQQAVAGAQQALTGRQQAAWPVVKAELAELNLVLKKLAETLAPPPAPAAAPTTAPPADETGATGNAPASQPATPPQTPAATTTPAPSATPSATPPATKTGAAAATGGATAAPKATAPTGAAAAR